MAQALFFKFVDKRPSALAWYVTNAIAPPLPAALVDRGIMQMMDLFV
jgi:hypothetical protein